MDDIHIGTLEKSGTQDLRAKLTTYHGREYLDVRTHVTLGAAGERAPTRKGITVPAAKIPELRALIERAEAEARAAGLLAPVRAVA